MNNQFDINYLRRYVKGELSADQMYAIEKASHYDEQLMTLISGLEEEQRLGNPMDLRDIHAAIYERTRPERKPVSFYYRVVAVAATVLLALTIGTIWLTYQKRTSSRIDRSYAVQDREEKPTDSAAILLGAIRPPETLSDEGSAVAEVPNAAEQQPQSQPPTRLSQQQQEKDQEKVIEEIVRNSAGTFLKREGPLLELPENDSDRTSPNPRLTAAQIEHSAVIQIDRRAGSPLTAYPQAKTVSLAALGEASELIRGVVLDLQSGRPITNATVQDAKTGEVVTTDSTGQYTISATSGDQILDILSIGYQSAQVSASNNKIIHLQPDFQVLDEIVVGRTSKTTRIKSVPLIGWSAYKKYINNQAEKSQVGQGKVTLRFELSSFGRPIAIRVEKSSNPDLNPTAVKIIQRGPDWKKGNDGKQIKVDVEFK